MIVLPRSMIWVAPLTITAALALILGTIPVGTTVRLLSAAFAFAGLMLVTERRGQAGDDWPSVTWLAVGLLSGCFLSAAFLLLLATTFPMRHGLNAIGLFGIPALVAVGQGRRSLAFVLPFTFFGWVAFGVLGWLLQVPLD